MAELPTIKQMMDLSGKTAIVTGGARGLGLAIVNRLSEAGARVMITDIQAELGQEATRTIQSKGRQTAFTHADVRLPADVDKMVEATTEKFGGLDILVNNAGVWDFASVLEMPEEGWNRVVDTNLKGPFLCAKAAAKIMVKQGRGGKIVNIASNGGIIPVFPASVLAHYYSSKGGLIMLTKALAKELIPHHINVNCVAPGGMMTGSDAGSAGGSPGVMTKEQWEEFKKVPPPMADPDEVACIVLVLATSLANYMVGETVVVDGGALLMHVYADPSLFTSIK